MRHPFLPVHILFWSCLIACNDDHPGKNKDSHQDTTANDTMQTDSVRLQVLVFSKTEGFHHASIADGNEAILQLGVAHDFEVEITTNAAYFTDDSLQQYAAVVFLSTTGDVLNASQEAAFERYIQAGGGYVGIHAASDTEYGWAWYGRLVGGYFAGHPAVQEATLEILDHEHPSTAHLSAKWTKRDEWYDFKDLNDEVNILINVDEATYEGGNMGNPHPISWYHEFDGGRAFYTAMGHTEESFSDPLFLEHVLGGIEYVVGGE